MAEFLEILAIAIGGGALGVLATAKSKDSGPVDGEKLYYAQYSPEPEKPRSNGVGSLVAGILGKALSSRSSSPGTASSSRRSLPIETKGHGVKNILDVIGRGEGGPGGYNAYYGGISQADAPPKPLTQMSVGEVLAWQDSIDPRYRSEAAGKYQIMEDTLRDLVSRGVVSTSARFNEATQDRLGTALLQRRGLSRYQAGEISPESFVNSIAKEWAGVPVATGEKAGRSYYDGINGNSATIRLDDILNAVRRA